VLDEVRDVRTLCPSLVGRVRDPRLNRQVAVAPARVARRWSTRSSPSRRGSFHGDTCYSAGL
jgi:hypothetical protein